jgi:uncharacterized protein (TIGR02145 family)
LTGTNWDNLIQKATEKDSKNRYADINSIRSAWQKGQNDLIERRDSGDKTVIEQQTKQPIPKIPPGPVEPPQKFSFVVPILILLMFMVAGYFFWNRNDKPIISSVIISDQEWQMKNLDVDRFRNGEPIPHALTAEEWKAAGEREEPAWCYYNNDVENGEIYGKLYNWYAVNDSRGLAPEGWHIPTDDEWTTLTDYLGGEEFAGDKMKTIGTSYWAIPNNEASNESGFSALPGGYRNFDSSFNNIFTNAFFWSATEIHDNYPCYRYLYNNYSTVSRSYDKMSVGASVRCLRD